MKELKVSITRRFYAWGPEGQYPSGSKTIELTLKEEGLFLSSWGYTKQWGGNPLERGSRVPRVISKEAANAVLFFITQGETEEYSPIGEQVWVEGDPDQFLKELVKLYN